jgi:hypothetical protein
MNSCWLPKPAPQLQTEEIAVQRWNTSDNWENIYQTHSIHYCIEFGCIQNVLGGAER